jgi:hypothetical protein
VSSGRPPSRSGGASRGSASCLALQLQQMPLTHTEGAAAAAAGTVRELTPLALPRQVVVVVAAAARACLSSVPLQAYQATAV